MKIAVTSVGPTLDDRVDARFGRCAYFLVVDSDSMEFEAIENPNIAVGGGAGIQSAQMMADKSVQAVLTGNCGPNAFDVFGGAGIRVIVGVSGIVRDAIVKYMQGALAASSEANVMSHFGMAVGDTGTSLGIEGGNMGRGMGGGMGGGRGMGRGMGGGRGMGRGMGGGRGMGRGMGQGMGRGTSPVRFGGGSEPITPIQTGIAVSSLVAVVDAEKCVGCGVCVPSCSVNAISLNETVHIAGDKCTGCGRCVADCPQEALSLRKR
jgi:predicted Fe-Mo cluster-binding NifX family protein/NAD-dependent dihydropyrimidine dehydrogenase PreA subunit